jgi:hypothetical protein
MRATVGRFVAAVAAGTLGVAAGATVAAAGVGTAAGVAVVVGSVVVEVECVVVVVADGVVTGALRTTCVREEDTDRWVRSLRPTWDEGPCGGASAIIISPKLSSARMGNRSPK